MSNKLLIDAGENYEYVRTIVENKVELAKIDLTERASKILSSIALYVVLSIVAVMFFVTLLIMLAVYLNTVFASTVTAILVTSGILLLIGVIFFLLRKQIFYKPIANFILTNIVEIKE